MRLATVFMLFVWVNVAAGANDGGALELLTLESFIQDATSTADAAKQKEALGRILQRPVPPTLASSVRLWQLRGAAALQLDKEAEGLEAGRKLSALGVASAGTSDALGVLVALNRKGWVESEADYAAREEEIAKFAAELAAQAQTLSQPQPVDIDTLKSLQEKLKGLTGKYHDPKLTGLQNKLAELWLGSLKLRLAAIVAIHSDKETKAAVAAFRPLVKLAHEYPDAKRDDLDALRGRAEALLAYYPTPTGMQKLLQRLVPSFGKQRYLDSTDWEHWTHNPNEDFPYGMRRSLVTFYDIDSNKQELRAESVAAGLRPGELETRITIRTNNTYEAEVLFKKLRSALDDFAGEQRQLNKPRKFLPGEESPTRYVTGVTHREG